MKMSGNGSHFRLIMTAAKTNNAARQPFVWPIGHDPPGRRDCELVAVNLEMANLFGADPFRIPGHINLGDPAISIQPVGPGVSNHAVQ